MNIFISICQYRVWLSRSLSFELNPGCTTKLTKSRKKQKGRENQGQQLLAFLFVFLRVHHALRGSQKYTDAIQTQEPERFHHL